MIGTPGFQTEKERVERMWANLSVEDTDHYEAAAIVVSERKEELY